MAASCSSVNGTLSGRSRWDRDEPRRLGGGHLARQRVAVLKSLRALGVGIAEAGLGACRDIAGELYSVGHLYEGGSSSRCAHIFSLADLNQ